MRFSSLRRESRFAIAFACFCQRTPRTTTDSATFLPGDLLERLGQARIVVTNYHAFLPRERSDASRADQGDSDQRSIQPVR